MPPWPSFLPMRHRPNAVPGAGSRHPPNASPRAPLGPVLPRGRAARAVEVVADLLRPAPETPRPRRVDGLLGEPDERALVLLLRVELLQPDLELLARVLVEVRDLRLRGLEALDDPRLDLV